MMKFSVELDLMLLLLLRNKSPLLEFFAMKLSVEVGLVFFVVALERIVAVVGVVVRKFGVEVEFVVVVAIDKKVIALEFL